ncbi:hypothetical protein EC991_005907 [Linnemannia zychae]|nr:hypothetical protein EC991_005907 [Linnemannia zychae]
MVPTPHKFHHYIPHFILKAFADNFSLDALHAEFIADTTTIFDPTANPGVQSGGNKRNKDVTADDSMKFEKLLGTLERTSATFIRKIWKGESLSLTRTQLADMKKFLCIMMYRFEQRRDQYLGMKFDLKTLYSIKGHMYNHKNIKRVQDWLIETPMDVIMEEFSEAYGRPPGDPFDVTGQEKTPIHVAELVNFGNMAQNIMCVWEAEEGPSSFCPKTALARSKATLHFLGARAKYLTYKSSVSMYKYLRYYDKVKSDTFLFHEHDYTILKRKLFDDLNRTHSS